MEAQLLDPGKKSRKWRSSVKKFFKRDVGGFRKNKLSDGDLKFFPDFDKQDLHNITINTLIDMESQDQDLATMDMSHASGSADSSPRCGSAVSSLSQRGYSNYYGDEEELSFDDASTPPTPNGNHTSITARTPTIVSSILTRRSRSNRSNNSSTPKQQFRRRASSPVPMVRNQSAPIPRMNSSSSVCRRRLLLSSSSTSNNNRSTNSSNIKKNNSSHAKVSPSNLFDAPFAAMDAYAPSVSYDEDEEDITRYIHNNTKKQQHLSQLQSPSRVIQASRDVDVSQGQDKQTTSPRSSHFWRSSSSPTRQAAATGTQRCPSLVGADSQWRSRSLNSNVRTMGNQQQQLHWDGDNDDDDEQGTEVILFQSERAVNSRVSAGDFLPDPDDFLQDDEIRRCPYDFDDEAAGDAIFLSLQPDATTTPITTIEAPMDGADDEPMDMAAIQLVQSRWVIDAPDKESRPEKLLRQLDESPTPSKDLTWVSSEQEEDDRPVKEIVFPLLVGNSLQQHQQPSMEKEQEQQQQQRLECQLDRAVNRSREQVRDAIFASLERDDDDNVNNVSQIANRSTDRDNNNNTKNDVEDQTIIEPRSYSEGSPSFDLLFEELAKDEFDEDVCLNVFAPPPTPTKESSSQKSSSASPLLLSSPLSKQQSQRRQHHEQQGQVQEQTSPSSATSKKNNQTLGPYDTGRVQDLGLMVPSSAELDPVFTPNQKSPSTAFLKRKSVFTGEDLLSQEAESFAEFLEDEGVNNISRIDFDSSQDGLDTNESPNTSQERFLSAMSAAEMDDDGFPSLSTAIESKLHQDVVVSVADRRLGNKSPYQRPMSGLSGVTTSVRSRSQTSAPFVSKSTSYDTSSWQSRASTTGDDFSHTKGKMSSSSHAPYCGGIVFSAIEDDDLTSDRSEDYSSDYSKKPKNKSTLEELQLDVLGAVQELARSASSNMMKFLKH